MCIRDSDWMGKLLICVDEVLLNRREDSERIKNLSTARSYKAEAKGRDRREVEFFGKFVLCSVSYTHLLAGQAGAGIERFCQNPASCAR